jgi:pentatricopeptide repeat protein
VLADYYNQLQKPSCRPTRQAWNLMIGNCIGKNSNQFHFSAILRTLFVDLCTKNNRVREADQLYKLMLSRNVIPDSFTFVSLINGHGRRGQILPALRYVQEMRDKKVREALHSYLSVCIHYSDVLALRSSQTYIYIRL